MSIPEFRLLSSAETSVISTSLLISLAEGGMSGECNEEDDTSSEEINLNSVIGLLGNNFWGHISLSSENGLHFTTSISSIKGGRESEIGNLKVHIFIE